MTGRRPARNPSRSSGRGIFLLTVLILAAGLWKYSDLPIAQAARQKAVAAIQGIPQFGEMLAVLGGDNPEILPVFQSQETEPTYAISSGGADDILGREETLFPDTVDQTVHPMKFDHVMPTDGTVTSSFGSRLSPITGQPGFHYGLDIAAEEGVIIGAFADGTVREIGESSYGNYLIVDHEDGFVTLYAHCSSITAAVGETVACGQEIARVGQTGNATGPHLHLELWKNGAALDPAHYVTQT